ncbi:MAG: polysaccharide deacetylase [Clostridia bacterium]|nr:polysaccharide deacetylase [Clostridia bacterium]
MKHSRRNHYSSYQQRRRIRHAVILSTAAILVALVVAAVSLVFRNRSAPIEEESASSAASSVSSESSVSESSVMESGNSLSSVSSESSSSQSSQESSTGSSSESSVQPSGNDLRITDRPKMSVLGDEEKVIYLTFDDGPCDTTRELLALLAQYDAKATFFVCCQTANQEKYIDALKDCSDQGHAVAVHTYSHKMDEVYSSPEAYYQDFLKMYNLIEEVTGKKPANFFRFPGGSKNSYNERSRKAIVEEMVGRGFIYYDWDGDSGDASGNHVPAETIYQNVMTSIHKGCNLILLHNTFGKETTIEALRRILPEAKAEGYTFKALDGTLDPTHYYIFTADLFIDAALDNSDLQLSDWRMAKLENQ